MAIQLYPHDARPDWNVVQHQRGHTGRHAVDGAWVPVGEGVKASDPRSTGGGCGVVDGCRSATFASTRFVPADPTALAVDCCRPAGTTGFVGGSCLDAIDRVIRALPMDTVFCSRGWAAQGEAPPGCDAGKGVGASRPLAGGASVPPDSGGDVGTLVRPATVITRGMHGIISTTTVDYARYAHANRGCSRWSDREPCAPHCPQARLGALLEVRRKPPHRTERREPLVSSPPGRSRAVIGRAFRNAAHPGAQR